MERNPYPAYTTDLLLIQFSRQEPMYGLLHDPNGHQTMRRRREASADLRMVIRTVIRPRGGEGRPQPTFERPWLNRKIH